LTLKLIRQLKRFGDCLDLTLKSKFKVEKAPFKLPNLNERRDSDTERAILKNHLHATAAAAAAAAALTLRVACSSASRALNTPQPAPLLPPHRPAVPPPTALPPNRGAIPLRSCPAAALSPTPTLAVAVHRHPAHRRLGARRRPMACDGPNVFKSKL
jgi:hypothetical protein